MTASVLIVEDEEDLAFLLRRNLEREGHRVEVAHTLAAARAALASPQAFELWVVDVNLPDGEGFSLVAELRGQEVLTPALFLTARTDEADRLMGFAVGGDDYVTKPFSMAELLARIAAIVRRSRSARAGERRYRLGEVRVDLDRFRLERGGRRHALTYLEAELLGYLLARAGEDVSRRELLKEVWGFERSPSTRTVDTHVLNLRKKLEDDPARPRHLLTVHGIGYRLVT